MKEEGVEEQGGEEAEAAATTAVELPNSTTSAMETSGGGEGPDSGGTSCPLSLHPETSGTSDEGHKLGGQGWGYNFSHHSCRQASSL